MQPSFIYEENLLHPLQEVEIAKRRLVVSNYKSADASRRPWDVRVGVYYLVLKEIKSVTLNNWNHFNVVDILQLLYVQYLPSSSISIKCLIELWTEPFHIQYTCFAQNWLWLAQLTEGGLGRSKPVTNLGESTVTHCVEYFSYIQALLSCLPQK